MKKYIKSLVLITLIVPCITYASWWNPFTWRIFQRNTQTTVTVPVTSPSDEISKLQAQIDELKSQQAPVKPTTTTPTITTTEQPKKKKTENWNTSLVLSAKSEIELLQLPISYVDRYVSYIDKRIDTINNVMENTRKSLAIGGIPALDAVERKALVAYKDDIAWMNAAKDMLNLNKAKLQKYIDSINADIVKWNMVSVSHEMFLVKIESFQLINVSKDNIEKIIYNIASDYNSNTQKQDAGYAYATQKILDYLNSLGEEINSPQYYSVPIPILIPKVEIPKTTSCTINSYGGDTSYMNCITQ